MTQTKNKAEPGTAVAQRSEYGDMVRAAAQLPPAIWPDERIGAIKRTVAPENAGDADIALFLAVAHRYELDPFVNEIWLVHDRTKGRNIVMTGRDAYLKIAMRDAGYLGINSGVVYSEDTFRQEKKGKEVTIIHEIHGLGDRGHIVGAYCTAYHAKYAPVTVIRTWNHYKKLHNKPNWLANPDDMIETRVITAALRRQYNISGLYTETEIAGIEEGDGALQDFQTNQNVLEASRKRAADLRAQLTREAEVEEAEVEIVPEEELEVTGVAVDGPEDAMHGPVSASLDAVIVEEEAPPEEEAEEDTSLEAKHQRNNARRRYMATWNETVGADKDFRQRWQESAIGKKSTKGWTIEDFDHATELIKSGKWTEYLVTPPGIEEDPQDDLPF